MNVIYSDTESKFTPEYYKQIINDKFVGFLRFSINNYTTFDNVFFPQKGQLINMLNRLREKKLRKLSLLLYGEPGCGKTSIIKAIAHYMNYHIVEVKLSYLSNDSELSSIFNSEYYMYGIHVHQINMLAYVNPARRIYVLEDVDAECEIIHERSTKYKVDKKDEKEKEELIDKKKFMDFIMKQEMKKSITLSGVLNALDGILEINGSIVIMTTNYIDKLDRALIRDGRVNMRVHLNYVNTKNAREIVARFYPDADVNRINNIEAMHIIPARIEGLCLQSATFEKFIKKLYPKL